MNRQLLNRVTSLLHRYSGTRSSIFQARVTITKRTRRLCFECCESRDLLSGASITGYKFATVLPSGFTPGADQPMGGVTINLYQDNGDHIFNPATDSLIQHVLTAANGSYVFNNVADGLYYVNETVPPGFVQSAGPAFYTVDVVGGAVYASSPAAQFTQIIDDFSVPDPAVTYFINAIDPNPFSRQDTGTSNQILGTQRDLSVNVLGAANPISANGFVGTLSMSNGVFNLGSATSGPGTEVTMKYDGVNDTGLTADLTANGGAGIQFAFDFLQVGSGTTMDVQMSATSVGGGTASFSGLITQNPTAFDLYVPFSQFSTSGGFDFTKVTGLQISFNTSGVHDVDYQLNQISVGGFNFGNLGISKRLFLTPANPVVTSATVGTATFSFNSTTGVMSIAGTPGNDSIIVAPGAKANAVVTLNGHVISNTIPLALIHQIDISGSDGNDTITLTNLAKPVSIDGGAGTDQLIVNGAAAKNTFLLNANSLLFNGVEYDFANLEGLTLNGQAKKDTLLVQSLPAFSTTFNGGGGTDTMIGPDTVNSWNVTSTGGGSLNTSLRFSGVENLVGGSSADTFNFSAGQKIAGTVDGGGGSNTLTYGTYNKAVAVNLQSKKATLTGGFANLESFVGGSAVNTLTGANQVNWWEISGVNSGLVNGTAFANFENLTGGTAADTFQFVTGGSVSGLIRGGGGSNKLDYSGDAEAATVNLQTMAATNTGGFTGINGVIGTSSTTLVGANKNSTWNITAVDSGNVNGFSFAGVGNLTGGSKNDTFVFADGSGVTGQIDGGLGVDILNYSAYTTVVTVSLTARTATNIGGGYLSIESIFGPTVQFV